MTARRGTAAVEFALTVPVLLILALGLVEWGWVFTREVAVIQAVRDGAVAGSCVRLTLDPVAAARSRVFKSLDASGFVSTEATVNAVVTPFPWGQVITVTVSVPYHKVVNLFPAPSVLEWDATMQMVDS